MKDIINTDTLLPAGERLKPLLNASCISEFDLKALLAERGVYLGSSDKRLSLSILTLSLLSPREFERLQELQHTKEDSLKTKVLRMHARTDTSLALLLPCDLIDMNSLTNEYDSFEFDTDLSFNIENPNKMFLDYTIIRQDITKDWANNKSRYSGRIEIEKQLSSHTIVFSSEYTSSETESVNKEIIE